MLQSSKITDKKQVTLPSYVMDALNLRPSDKVEFLLDDSSPLSPVVKIKKIKNFLDLKGSIKSNEKYDDKGAMKAIGEYFKENYYNDRLNP